MNKRKLLLLMGGSKKTAWSAGFDGTSTYITLGSHNDVQSLPESVFSIDFFARNTIGGDYKVFWVMGSSLSTMRYGETNTISSQIVTDGTDGKTLWSDSPDNTWHHWACCYDNGGERIPKVYKDGVLITQSVVASTGTVISAVGSTFIIGARHDALTCFWGGEFGWFRISNSMRYTSAFVPPNRFDYPAVDANTVRLFKMNEGTGTTIIDYSANAQNATLVNGTWVNL